MKVTVKDRMVSFIKVVLIFFMINFICQYFFKHSTMDSYTIIPYELVPSLLFAFADKIFYGIDWNKT